MRDILSEIIDSKRVEVSQRKGALSLEQLKAEVAQLPERKPRSMRRALSESESGIIAEFKRRSPSKGWIKESAEASVIPASYEVGGAAALSILTDEKYFGGGVDDIIAARKGVSIPIIRKEFIVDEYQLFEARKIDADAVLLIAAALEVEECWALVDVAHELGLEVLLELHAESELKYVREDIDMVGVNNRNLGTFHTDVENSFRMAELLPKGMVKVSESGISDPATVNALRKVGFRGFLIGENFMRTEQPGEALREFIEGVER